MSDITPGLTYKADEDSGMIGFFVDGEEVTEWSYEDDPELVFHEFKEIYDLGWTNSEQQNKALQEANDELKASNSRLRENLEAAVCGLEWYQQNCPDVASNNDNENLEDFSACLDELSWHSLALHDAEVIEKFAKEIGVFDSEYDDQGYVEVPKHRVKEYAQQLREGGSK